MGPKEEKISNKSFMLSQVQQSRRKWPWSNRTSQKDISSNACYFIEFIEKKYACPKN